MQQTIAVRPDETGALAAASRPGSAKGVRRLDSLQVLRALAAMAVVLFHLHWTGIASFGVELFFVISGFVISHAAAADSRRFLARRVFRVVPLYWLATVGILALAIVAPSLAASTDPTAGNLVRSLFFVPYARADGAAMPLLFLGWTLNYEAFFYIVFAGCLLVSRRHAPLLALGILAALALAHEALAQLGVAADFWSRPVILNFACGIAAWTTWRHGAAPMRRTPPLFAAAISLATIAAYAFGLHQAWQAAWGVLPVSGAMGAVLVLAMLRLEDAFAWPASILLAGDASYSLYLLHPYSLEAVARFAHPFDASPAGLLASAMAIGLSLGIAVLAFRLIERPSNRFLRRRFG